MSVPIQVLDREQAERLLAYPDRDDVLGLRDAALLATLYYAAATAVEAANVNVGDVSWRRSEILLRSEEAPQRRQQSQRRRPQRRRRAEREASPTRRVAMETELAEILEDYRERSRRLILAQAGTLENEPRALFLGNRPQRIRVQDIRQILGTSVKGAGIEADVNLNTLRLSRAWHLREEGRSPESIQRFLGATSRSGRNVI